MVGVATLGSNSQSSYIVNIQGYYLLMAKYCPHVEEQPIYIYFLCIDFSPLVIFEQILVYVC